MQSFVVSNMIPNKVAFGSGVLESLPYEARKIGCQSIFIVTDKGLTKTGIPQKVQDLLMANDFSTGIFDRIIGEPTMKVVNSAVSVFNEGGFDSVLGVGGGSCMDTAKAIAGIANSNLKLEKLIGKDKIGPRKHRLILVPTTAGTGSEATPNALFIDEEEKSKKALISSNLLPDIALLDPKLTIGLPPHISAATGLDALAHCVESWISKNSNAVSDAYAFQGIRLIARSLQKVVLDGDDVDSRGDMLLGSFFGGLALSIAGTGGVHALSYPLGSRGVPHGVANGLLMPRVLKYNKASCLKQLADIAILFGVKESSEDVAASKVVECINQLLNVLPVPKTLDDIKISADLIPSLAEESQLHQRLLRNNPCHIGTLEAESIYRECLYF